MNEYWKVLRGFRARHGGYYWVSSLGRFKNPSGKILKFHPHKKGYLMIQIPKDGYAPGSRWQAHRLVAKSFIPNPDQLPQVNHLDGDKKNNAVSNLQWCTNLGNMQHSWATGLRRKESFRKETRLTNEQILAIRNAILRKGPYATVTRKTIAEQYGISEHVVKDIRRLHSYAYIS